MIRTGEDYRDITYEYLMSCAAEGAIYVELTASPDHAKLVGLSDEEHLDGIARGIDDARAASGIEGRILISCVRNFGVEPALRVARYAAELPHPYVVGFSMAGDEENYPPAAYAEAFEIAAAAGLGCTRPRGRVGGARERARGAHAAGEPHRARRALDRGPGPRRGAGRARHRAGGLPHQQRGARHLPDLRGAPAAAADGRGRAGDARIRRPSLLRRDDRRASTRCAPSTTASTTRR